MGRLVEGFIKINGVLSVIFLVSLAGLTATDIFLRTFFKITVKGGHEIAVILLASIGFFGYAWCALKGEHVTVDLISKKISTGLRLLLDSINYFVAMGLSVLVAVQSYERAMFMKDMNQSTSMLNIPEHLFYLVAVYGFTLLFMAAVILQYRTLKTAGNLSLKGNFMESNPGNE